MKIQVKHSLKTDVDSAFKLCTELPPFSGCRALVPTIFTGTPLISTTMSEE